MSEQEMKQATAEQDAASKKQATTDPETESNKRAATDPEAESKQAKAGQEGAESAQEEQNSEGSAADEENSDEKAAEAADTEKYLRLLAEFQNFKKRTAKEKTDIHAYANEKIVNELLPVLDNFERALATNPSDDPEAYAKGMELIFEQMKTALDKSGVKEIPALGETFDPNLHNAVMMADSEEFESGKVCNELQKGYTLNDKVIRPSMVAVSK